ncbi:MAG TPA: DUF4476 domain-containing protein [Chitinophagaceae bacterium]|nr:DUF4476 domain-containing protein [Chitinophagaceae bacterium]
MKQLFTLLLATVFSTAAFAADEGRLTLSVSTPNEVQVVIDNRSYRTEDRMLTLRDLRPGSYTVKVYRQRSNNRNDRNNGGILGGAGDRNDLLYATTVQVRPNHHVDIMVNRFGKGLVDERPMRGGYGSNDGYENDRNDRDEWDESGWNDHNQNERAMESADFERLVQQVRSQWFSNSKMNAAREGVNRNYFTTEQVRTLVQLFNSDTDKLELAKLAYSHTVDPRNYYLLNEVFSFQSSREELDRYTRGQR